MCGFAICFNSEGQLPITPKPFFDQTLKSLAHRGPDGSGNFADNYCLLAHRRLAIIDTSVSGTQPMWDSAGRFGIIFNGEIYNYKDLKKEIGHYYYHSETDTEVLLAGFQKWGTALFLKLNGMFSFALYDKREKELYLVRDRFGVKPLYFSEQQGTILAGSEIRTLLSTGLVSRQIDRKVLVEYFRYGSVGGEQSLVKGIRQLPAGYYLHVTKKETTLNPFCHFFESEVGPLITDTSHIEENVLFLFQQSVKRQLVSDVPLGAFLSGGIDSSAIVALMSEVSNRAPHTFSVAFHQKGFDEQRYADIIAKQYNTIHTVIPLSAKDFLKALPEALSALDTPSVDGANTFVVAKAAHKAGIVVVLSGLGGDELFAGYPTFQRYQQLRHSMAWKIPAPIRQGLVALLPKQLFSARQRRMFELLSIEHYQLDEVYPHFRSVLDDYTISRLLPDAFLGYQPSMELLEEKRTYIASLPYLSQYSVAELAGYTRKTLLKDTDQMSMASSLEVRVPFFDNDLVDYVLRIPDNYKQGITPKKLLVDCLKGRLPKEITQRPKMGFSLPWENWLKRELSDFCQLHLEQLAERRILNNRTMFDLWKNFRLEDPSVRWGYIWMLVALSSWMQANEIES